MSQPETRIWVSEDRTLLITLWPDNTATVAQRISPDHIWGPPRYLKEEKT